MVADERCREEGLGNEEERWTAGKGKCSYKVMKENLTLIMRKTDRGRHDDGVRFRTSGGTGEEGTSVTRGSTVRL